MADGILDTELVRQKIDENGWKRNWVFQQIGLKRSRGYQLIRDGLLPKDLDERDLVLRKLSGLIGIEIPKLFLRLERPKRKAS